MTDNELLLALSNMMDEKLKPLQDDIGTMQNSITTIETNLDDISRKVTALEMTLENEVNHNIMVIAEGHLDLSRKLDESIRISSDIKAKQELQDIYINRHENKLKIKDIS
ncbi:hypothetical protein AALB39_04350 [Lachnospiraceae bacterium 54-53]